MSKAKRIALDGLLAAVYFALSFLTIPIGGNLQLRFTSLALVVAGVLFGPLDGAAVGLVGESLYQLILFGPSATTPIWVLPPVIHGLVLGLLARLLGRQMPLERRPAVLYGVCMGCAVLNSVLNTAALYADSKIFGYYSRELVFGVALIRLAIGLATGAIVTSVAIAPLRALRRRM